MARAPQTMPKASKSKQKQAKASGQGSSERSARTFIFSSSMSFHLSCTARGVQKGTQSETDAHTVFREPESQRAKGVAAAVAKMLLKNRKAGRRKTVAAQPTEVDKVPPTPTGFLCASFGLSDSSVKVRMQAQAQRESDR
jgi:hypothetical protein